MGSLLRRSAVCLLATTIAAAHGASLGQPDVTHELGEAQQLMDQKIGRRQKRSKQREQQDLQRREDDAVEGHAVYRLAAYVSLTARSLPELEHLSPQIESALNACCMEGTRWYVETDQAFVAAALPFATGLH